MLINADFAQPAIVAAHEYQWIPSPQRDVERVMLDRVGAEQARATSIVRYAAHAHFPWHSHPGGEEILVLAGSFSEGDAHYPAGWYLRNPPDSSHRPSSSEGATLFVKLQQMQPHQQRRVRIDTGDAATWYRKDTREVCPLFSDETEQVCLQRLGAHERPLGDSAKGIELLVLRGHVEVAGRSYGSGSWMRWPAGRSPAIVAGGQGATVYLKTGHLADVAGAVS